MRTKETGGLQQPPINKRTTVVYGLARRTQAQIKEAERLWREFRRTHKEKHRVAYEKHVAAMLAERPNLTSEDKKKRAAWERVERLAGAWEEEL